ncbi:MAG: alpha-glucan family phosphorylase [Acidobacteria bacterium]|nr:alpha-glucan family phosphorylase [Acidobacteriota bacterium]
MSETAQEAQQDTPTVNFREDFNIDRRIPEALRPLFEISMNFYWSWQPEGVALFRDLDSRFWDKSEQRPRVFLENVESFRLWLRACDPAYVERLNQFAARQAAYLSVPANEGTALAPTPKIAYFCAEYGVHNSLPIYSGGLGILAGDHLKSASDLNLPLTAIGLFYRYGFFRQHVNHEGWQEETYNDLFDTELALSPVVKEDGSRLTVSVHIRGREVVCRAWLAKVGRISLYLLDTNVPENSEVDRLITGHLYGGDSETRIVQEKVLGIGGVRLLRALGIGADVYHLNEGHAGFSTLELASEFLAANPDKNFADAIQAVREKCVFTTHTPVAAGNDAFEPNLLLECFSQEYLRSLKITHSEFLALGRANLSDDKEYFGMTPLAIRMCRSSNGVSEKHGHVSRQLWLKMFPGLADAEAVPITAVTNGVHAPTWISPLLQSLYCRELGANWHEAVCDVSKWGSAVWNIPDEDIWRAHQALKGLLISYVRRRTATKDAGTVETIHENEDTATLFSSEVLTIGFARRVAEYKRWDLIFSDLPRLLRMVDDEERPVQFVFAGKAHPQDKVGKSVLQELLRINSDSNWQRRAVFIEDYDQEVARYLVRGVDVWMNVPRRPMEASGTSGMKAAMNGALNFSILDGWWIEGYNGKNGFAIGGLEATGTDEEIDKQDAESLYSTLETEVIPAYYEFEDGIRKRWIGMMREAIGTLTPQFSTDRMVGDYLERIYKQ